MIEREAFDREDINKMNNREKMAIIGIIVILAFLLFAFGAMTAKSFASSGRAYYVSKSGSDSGSGTSSSPYRTFGYAIGKLKAGDTLYIKGGTYTESMYISAAQKGTAKKYITICNAPGEKVILSGNNQRKTLIHIKKAAYIRIRGLELCYAYGLDACGIAVDPGTRYLKITGNRFHDIAVPEPTKTDHCANCILLYGNSAKYAINHVNISGNKFYNCQTGWAECISVTGNATSVKVDSNSITNTGNIGIDFSGNYGYCRDPKKDFPRRCEAKGNTVTSCVSRYATSYGIYVDGGQRIKITGNTVRGCGGGIEIGAEQKPKKYKYSTKNIMVSGNKLSGNLESAITIGGYEKKLGRVRNVTVSKNKCSNNGKDADQAVLTLSKCTGVKVKNNVFHNDKVRCAIVYSEFSSKYVKKVTFRSNKFYNGGGKASTLFVWRNKEYTSFSKWNKKVGGKAGKYTK